MCCTVSAGRTRTNHRARRTAPPSKHGQKPTASRRTALRRTALQLGLAASLTRGGGQVSSSTTLGGFLARHVTVSAPRLARVVGGNQ